MGGSDTKSTVVSSASSNPEVNKTLTSLLKGVQSQYSANPNGAVFNESLFTPAGATTQQGWSSALGAAGNQDYASGVNGAISNLSDVAAGKYLDNTDPDYQKLVDTAANGTAADINASMGADGNYGSNVHVNALADAIGNLRLGAGVQNRQNELTRQSNAIAELPGLYSASQQPAATIGAVGAAEDANQQGILQGSNDLFRRQNDAPVDTLAKYFSLLGSGAQTSGQTQTTTQPATPWWQSLLGFASGAAGGALRAA